MINKLSKEKYFKYDSKELLGVMRFDFYDGRLSNQWNPRELIIEMNDRKLIDLKKLQQELNYIQFTVVEDCLLYTSIKMILIIKIYTRDIKN